MLNDIAGGEYFFVEGDEWIFGIFFWITTATLLFFCRMRTIMEAYILLLVESALAGSSEAASISTSSLADAAVVCNSLSLRKTVMKNPPVSCR
jgi:hypothetical protein